MSRVDIHIVTYNAGQALDDCLKSVVDQTFLDRRITVIDNASGDGTAERALRWASRSVQVRRNPTNEMYARAHNAAIRASDADLVLTLNQDVLLRADWLQRTVEAMDSQPGIGSVNGKLLLRAVDEPPPDLTADPDPDRLIDSAGLLLRRSRRPYLRGYRQPHQLAANQPLEIFGVDGAAALYRRSALEDVAIDGEYFDEEFVMYREDVDLAWRARLFGWRSWYEPRALGYHVRGFHLGGNRGSMPPSIRRHSVKNGWLLLMKNESPASLLRDLPWIVPYQARILAGLLTVERSSLPAIKDTVDLWPRMRHKRTVIQARRRRTNRELRRWLE